MNVRNIIKDIKDINKDILKIMNNGLKFSLVFCLLACLILVTYISTGGVIAYNIGISLLKSGIFYVVGFLICGVAFNSIMKEL